MRPQKMRVWPISLAVLLLTACSTTQLPISPHKIDVQQGNVIDQEVLDKLKPGLTRSQVRFLLGTPLVVDPFRDNRWDYVYNYRSAGKLTAQRRLTLFFERDVLSRIETSGLEQSAGATAKAETAPPAPESPTAESQAQIQPPAPAPGSPTEPTPTSSQEPPAAAAEAKELAPTPATAAQPRVRTSVVPPLEPPSSKPAPKQGEAPPPQPVTLQSETDASELKPDVMPTSPQPVSNSDAETQVLAAVRAWAKAWSDRNEEAYLAAYASSFKPGGGVDKAEWVKRRRLLFNLSKNIEVRVDSPVVEFPAQGRALISFNQYYRSATYHDTVVKQLLMGLQDGRWLILEERVLPAARNNKKK